jgi:hypothetical protein
VIIYERVCKDLWKQPSYHKRVDPKTLDSVITKELKIRGITAKFGYGVIDKNNNLQALPIKPIKRKKTTIPIVILFYR